MLRHSEWRWVLLGLALSAVTYVGATLSLTGFVLEKLSWTRTLLAQLAGSFVTLVTPAAVGGVALNIRYLNKAKVPRAEAASSVGVSQVFAFALGDAGDGPHHHSGGHRQFERKRSQAEESADAAGESGKDAKCGWARIGNACAQAGVERLHEGGVNGEIETVVDGLRQPAQNAGDGLASEPGYAGRETVLFESGNRPPEGLLIFER